MLVGVVWGEGEGEGRTTAPTTVGMLLICGTLYLFFPSAVFSDLSQSAIHVCTLEPHVRDQKLPSIVSKNQNLPRSPSSLQNERFTGE